jgi:thiamine-phosphate pyrophosphorylase
LLLCYITDRTQLGDSESQCRLRLLGRVQDAVEHGVDYIQLREKDLPVRQLESLAREAVHILREFSTGRTKLLINSRVDVAMSVCADGVHLRSNDLSPVDVRRACRAAGNERLPVIAVSCHTEAEVARAADAGADFAVFGPVFEKKDSPDFIVRGIDRLHSACDYNIPVLALGGVTHENAPLCLKAGAQGVAGIRLFQEGDMAETIARL